MKLQLNITSITKQGVKDYVNAIVESIKENGDNPLDIAIQLKAMEDAIKDLRTNPDIQDMQTAEAMKYGKDFEYKGAKITVKETGVSYDYSVCDDSEYNDRLQELELIKEKIKSRELFLKALKEPMASTKTGEIINPPIRKGKLGITVTLK